MFCVIFHLIAGVDGNGVAYTKKFWYPTHFLANWQDAKLLCNSYKMQFATLDSQREADTFLFLYGQKAALFTIDSYIGAITTILLSTTDYYWVESGLKVNFPLIFTAGQPNNQDGNQMCLAVNKADGYKFNDLGCYSAVPSKFFCQTFV